MRDVDAALLALAVVGAIALVLVALFLGAP
jgi:hypothetical protein